MTHFGIIRQENSGYCQGSLHAPYGSVMLVMMQHSPWVHATQVNKPAEASKHAEGSTGTSRHIHLCHYLDAQHGACQVHDECTLMSLSPKGPPSPRVCKVGAGRDNSPGQEEDSWAAHQSTQCAHPSSDNLTHMNGSYSRIEHEPRIVSDISALDANIYVCWVIHIATRTQV